MRGIFWCYTKKVDNKKKRRYNRIKRQEEKEMAGTKSPRYSEEFKKTIVNLHQNGKSYAEIEQEYGVSHSALAKWIKQYSAVRLDDDTLITAEQIKSLQKRNAQFKQCFQMLTAFGMNRLLTEESLALRKLRVELVVKIVSIRNNYNGWTIQMLLN